MAHTQSTMFHHLIQCLTWTLDPYQSVLFHSAIVSIISQSVCAVHSNKKLNRLFLAYPNFTINGSRIRNSSKLLNESVVTQPSFRRILAIFWTHFFIWNVNNGSEHEPFSLFHLQFWNLAYHSKTILMTHCFTATNSFNHFKSCWGTFFAISNKFNIGMLLHCFFSNQELEIPDNCYFIMN